MIKGIFEDGRMGGWVDGSMAHGIFTFENPISEEGAYYLQVRWYGY